MIAWLAAVTGSWRGGRLSRWLVLGVGSVWPLLGRAQVLPAPGQVSVFVGSVYDFAALARPAIAAPLLACGHVGVYWHGGSLAYAAHPAALVKRTTPALSPYAPDGCVAAIARAFAGTGGGLAEMDFHTDFDGPDSEWAKDYVDQGAHPRMANWSEQTSGDPAAFQSEAQMKADLAQFAAMRGAGVATISVFATPDAHEPTDWDAAYWDRARTLALAGGGIAFDAPAGYALHRRGADYRGFVVAATKWAGSHHLAVSLSLDTYSEDRGYRADTIDWVRYLWSQGAYPTNYVVQSFSPAGAVFGTTDPDSLNAVALWMCEHGLVRAPS